MNTLSEKSVDQMDPRLIKHYNKAQIALQNGHSDYSLTIAQFWTRKHPEVVEFRKLLRESQIKKKYPEDDYFKLKPNPLTWLSAEFLRRSLEGKMLLNSYEWLLNQFPLDIYLNESLARLFDQFGWEQSRNYSWETLLLNPNRKASHVSTYADILISENNEQDAIRMCESFLKVFPNNQKIMDALKKASIKRSMKDVMNP